MMNSTTTMWWPHPNANTIQPPLGRTPCNNDDNGQWTQYWQTQQCSNMNDDKGPPPLPTNSDGNPPPPCTNGDECPAPPWTNGNEATTHLWRQAHHTHEQQWGSPLPTTPCPSPFPVPLPSLFLPPPPPSPSPSPLPIPPPSHSQFHPPLTPSLSPLPLPPPPCFFPLPLMYNIIEWILCSYYIDVNLICLDVNVRRKLFKL